MTQKNSSILRSFLFCIFGSTAKIKIKIMKKLAMHWKILIGMIVGLLFGLLMKNLEQKGLLLTD
jgi:Na+/H+-dicarboxylate symporter